MEHRHESTTCAVRDDIRGVQLERSSEVCSGEGIGGVQWERASEVCSERWHQRCAVGEGIRGVQ